MSKLQVILPILVILLFGTNGCTLGTPTPRLGSRLISPVDGTSLIFVPSGKFSMGSEIGLTDERPVHIVYLDAYWIAETEVTNAMYNRCVQSGACIQPSVTTYFNDPIYLNHPVVYVSWTDANAYCGWAGLRLPTEAEWEKVASWDLVKNEKLIYPWGNEFDCKKGNYEGSSCDGFAITAPVGSFPAGVSPYGALDMGGNVWEWVHDTFLETDPLSDSVENYYAISPDANPQGVDPSISVYRVMRGGAWSYNFGFGRVAYRLWFGLDDRYDFAGFRCVKNASP